LSILSTYLPFTFYFST